MSQESSKQLTISFDHDSLIAPELAKGTFAIHVELNLPEQKVHWMNAAEMIRHLDAKNIPGLAYTIRRSTKTAVSELEQLKCSTMSPFLVTLPGARSDIKQLREDAAAARSFGIRNFLVVTGNIDPSHMPEQDGSFKPFNLGYTDSLEAIAALYAPEKPQSIAATVNPFMYTPESQCLQYAKLLRKVSAGAQFAIMQAGWDMKKAQELQWFLQMRECIVPLLARIRYFTPEAIENLTSQPEPGVSLPVPIGAKMQRLVKDKEQFDAYQRQLIALQVAGYKKLGFAGILIAGIDNVNDFDLLLDECDKIDASINSYDKWRNQWFDFNGDISFVPPPSRNTYDNPHYLYGNLLEPEQPFFDPHNAHFTSSMIQPPSKWTSLKASLLNPNSHSLLAKATQAVVKPDTKLSACYGLDNSSCPKRLTTLPCGNVQPDGFCEANHAPCFFNEIARIAAERNEVNLLDEPPAPLL